jgi:hypothetical protein
MANEREAQTNRAPFHKFTEIGQALAGRVTKFGNNDNGAFIELHPVLSREERGGAWVREDAAIAVGLATDLGMKIDGRADMNKYLLIEFTDTEPSKRGQPKKIFRVLDLTLKEIVGLRDGTFTVPDAEPRKTPAKAAEEIDDLPF